MVSAWVMIVLAQNTNGIFDIGPTGGHRVHSASNHPLVYSRITGFFVRLPPLKLYCHWSGNWSELIHSELRQGSLNVAALMDVDHEMLPIESNVHAEIDGDTPEIMHPEPRLHLILHLPNHAIVTNDKDIIDVQNQCSDAYAMILLVIEHKQSSVHTWYHEPKQYHDIGESAIANM
jgi:hypothetical protein